MLNLHTDASSLRSLRYKLKTNSSSIRSVQSKLRQTKKQQKHAIEDLAVAERRLQVTKSGLDDIRFQLRSTKNKLSNTTASLKSMQNKLNSQNELLAKRLADTYKHGSMNYLGIILGSDDFWELISRSYVIKKIILADTSLINDIKEDKKLIEAKKTMLTQQLQKRSELELQHRNLTRSAYNQKVARGKILHNIERQRYQYEVKIAELERDSKSIESMLKRLEKTPKGRKRLAQAWKGSFAKPVNGRISSSYGMRFHPVLKRNKFHTGVDIAAPKGTAIRAAGNGEVIYSGWYGAYGNTIIIDHGGGKTTLYGHCSSLLVRNGSTVKKGQTIARVGSTGWSTGNHCHFEVRVHGKPTNPF
jgi:murein DD-endopeptidase MepM/ murein hydrolase activator NlpD